MTSALPQQTWGGRTRKEYDMDRREAREAAGLCIFCGSPSRRRGRRVLQLCARCGERDASRKRRRT